MGSIFSEASFLMALNLAGIEREVFLGVEKVEANEPYSINKINLPL